MISGAHAILYSRDAEADRAFLKDVLKFTHVDVGGGWLIFGLPPAEVAVHPGEKNDMHELYLMCDDVEELVSALARQDVACSPIQDQGWGLITQVSLPGGGKLGIYEPRHARPKPATKAAPRARKAARKPARKRAAKKPAAKKKQRR